MGRQVKIGDVVTDHFPVFEDDGFTKHPGLLAADFVTTIYRNSAISGIPATITEIGSSGEYAYSFTPNAPGDWDIQIHVLYNDDVLGDEFEAVDDLLIDMAPVTLEQCKKIDLSATLTPGSVVTGSLMDRLMNKSGAKTYNQATDSLEAARDELETIKALLHHNAILDRHVYVNGLLASARLRMFDSSANVPLNPGGAETTGLVVEFRVDSTYDQYGLNNKYTLKKVWP